MIESPILSLTQIYPADLPRTGTKAATLGHLFRAGLPIPDGFVVPTTAFQAFVQRNDIADTIAEIEALSRGSINSRDLAVPLGRLDDAFEQGPLDDTLVEALRHAFAKTVEGTGAVVVRSSAVGEDLSEASFAGQQLTILNVRYFDELLQALRRCWASPFSLPAIRYRARVGSADQPSAIAAIVQAQIIGQAAGTLFTVDPMTGDNHLVVEAVWGMGEALAQGEVCPDRHLVDRETLGEASRPRIGDKRCQRVVNDKGGTRIAPVPLWRRHRPILNPTQLGGLALLGLQVERLLGAPQDVEWGLSGGRWFIFQARPITTRPATPEDETRAVADCREWTSGFLDERLSEPVSPLGWSLLKAGLENVAFREPLRMLGVDPSALEPITRLWNGRPYVNVAVFEALYKLFPDALLPEDARRFFPAGNVARRHCAAQPTSMLSPRVWLGLLAAVAREPLTISPLHNDRAWDRFERGYVQAIAEIAFTVDVLDRQPPPSLRRIHDAIDEVERRNRQLLRIHRWSLTYAETWYSLLRRITRAMLGPERAARFCAEVVADLGDYSVELNRAFADLAALSNDPNSEGFQQAFDAFLATQGHRSFSLDLIRPNFAADPAQVIALMRGGRKRGSQPSASSTRHPILALLAPIAGLTGRYARLRENQRLTWQRGLALLRRLYLLAGQTLVYQGKLLQADDVFFITADEVRSAESTPAHDLKLLVASRRRQYAEDCAQTSYPHFLRGDQPVDEDPASQARGSEQILELRGEPVSPGVGRGRARIVLDPSGLDAVEPGDVLIARGADPGWTTVFDRLAALVMETGGQLSHASVVAREYRLPAVVGIPGATEIIQPGEELMVDGSTGLVRRTQSANLARSNELASGSP